MRGLRALLLALVALASPPATAEEVVAGFSRTQVAITTGFAGTEVFVYGAIKRSAPQPGGQLDVVVTVLGPSEPVMVRRKVNNFGIWMNGPGVQIDTAPSFYAVATTRPFYEAVSYTDDMRHQINLPELIRLIDAPVWLGPDRSAYLDALVRLREERGLYFLAEGGVALVEDTLFDTRIELPANLVEGNYIARIFLLRDRAVIDSYEETIYVRKEGLERIITLLAREQSLIYGLASIAVALLAGWGASALMRLVFN